MHSKVFGTMLVGIAVSAMRVLVAVGGLLVSGNVSALAQVFRHANGGYLLADAASVTARATVSSHGIGLTSASAHDWPQAISQLKEGLELCGSCRALAQLHKDLGLIYCHSGDMKSGLLELLEAKKLTPEDPDIERAIRIAQAAQK